MNRIVKKITSLNKKYIVLVIVILSIILILLTELLVGDKKTDFKHTSDRTSTIKKGEEASGNNNENKGNKEVLPTIKKEDIKADEINKEKKRYFGGIDESSDKITQEMNALIKEKNKQGNENKASNNSNNQEGKPKVIDQNTVQKIGGLHHYSYEDIERATSKNTSMGETMSPKQKMAMEIFNHYLGYNVRAGQILNEKMGNNGDEKNNNSNEDNENELKENKGGKTELPKGIKKWKFYKASIEIKTSNAQRPLRVIAIGTDPAVKGVRFVGNGELNATMDRIIVEFDKMIVDDVAYDITGRGYSIDKSDGIVAYIKRHDIQSAAINLTASLARGIAEASRRDRNETIFLPNGTAIQTKRMAKNRFNEAMYSGLSDAANKTEKLIQDNQKLYPPVEVVLQRGMPILVRIEE